MRIAVGRHDIAVAVEMKRAAAGVSQVAAGLPNLEESVALDHDVERVVGLREIALRENDFVR